MMKKKTARLTLPQEATGEETAMGLGK